MITRSDVEDAFKRISPQIRQTPVMDCFGDFSNHDTPISLKLELFQHTGSFKPRGAFNNLLTREVPTAGVAAASGGNHGAAVAYAAKKLGHKAKIFVPEISTLQKIEKIKSAGAELLVEGAKYVDALALCETYQAETGAMSIHAYDSDQTIAGQGTVGLEWLAQVGSLDTLLVAVGGGGLIAGIIVATKGLCNVVAVEPEGSCCLQTALNNDALTSVEVNSVAADSLGATELGGLPFEICREGLHQSLAIPDTAIKQAQLALWKKCQIVSEPGGATALAALTCGAYKPQPGERIGVLVCGGNTDLDAFHA
ncbi:MAG: threonine/serine dehydratase [Hyphomicrobiales bacterium]